MYLVRFIGKTDAKFWDRTHELSPLQESLYDRLVPDSGEADTPHGELLRMICHLHYDIYNNGLCNDKSPEVDYILQSVDKFRAYLTDEFYSISLLRRMQLKLAKNDTHEYGEVVNPFNVDQDFCNRIDDIVAAIVKYVDAIENQLKTEQLL
jgi:hypothetical protein